MLENLWKKRVQQQLKTTSHQLRYIFNDHFSLVIVFLIGLSSYGYAQWLTTSDLEPFRHYILVGVALVLTMVLQIGQFTTFIQESDQFFLHHLEQDWKTYFKRAFVYSMILPSVLLTFSFVVVYPLLVKVNGTVSLGLLALLLLLKVLQLLIRWYCFYNTPLQSSKYAIGFVSFLCILLSFWSVLFSIAFVILLIAIAIYAIHKVQALDWDTILHVEKKRYYRKQQLLKLFIDVNQESIAVKKHSILDRLYQPSQGAAHYLYQRHFIRLPFYKELIIKLSILFIILGLVINNSIVLFAVGILCQWLLILQVIPAYTYYHSHSMYLMLPLSTTDKREQFSKVLHKVSLCQVAIISVFLIIKLPIIDAIVYVIALFVIEKTILTLYVRQKLGKIDG